MRYILTMFWAILLMFMLTYVVSAMVGVALNLQIALTHRGCSSDFSLHYPTHTTATS